MYYEKRQRHQKNQHKEKGSSTFTNQVEQMVRNGKHVSKHANNHTKKQLHTNETHINVQSIHSKSSIIILR